MKPQLGSDSYMSTFARTVSTFTPSKFRSRETSKVPPKEEDIVLETPKPVVPETPAPAPESLAPAPASLAPAPAPESLAPLEA